MPSWEMWAHRCTDHVGDTFWENFGEKWWVDIHHLPDPVVPVRLTEDPDGTYWGWIETGEDTPVMVQSHEGMFGMQFTYGPKVEVECGKGRIVRLTVVELEPDVEPKKPAK